MATTFTIVRSHWASNIQKKIKQRLEPARLKLFFEISLTMNGTRYFNLEEDVGNPTEKRALLSRHRVKELIANRPVQHRSTCQSGTQYRVLFIWGQAGLVSQVTLSRRRNSGRSIRLVYKITSNLVISYPKHQGLKANFKSPPGLKPNFVRLEPDSSSKLKAR